MWFGDVVASPDAVGPPHIEALVELLESGEDAELRTVTLPLRVLRFASIARVLRELPLSEAPGSAGIDGGPGPELHFADDHRQIDLWFGRPETALVTAEEIPALGIAKLAGHPRFGFPSTPLCVVADRPARRLAVLPCWGDLPILLRSVGPGGAARLWGPQLGTPEARSAAGAL